MKPSRLRVPLAALTFFALVSPSGAPLYTPTYAEEAASIDRLLENLRQTLGLNSKDFTLPTSAASAWFALGPCQFRTADVAGDGIGGIQIMMGNDLSSKWRVAASAIVGIYSTQGFDKVSISACRYAKEHAAYK